MVYVAPKLAEMNIKLYKAREDFVETLNPDTIPASLDDLQLDEMETMELDAQPSFKNSYDEAFRSNQIMSLGDFKNNFSTGSNEFIAKSQELYKNIEELYLTVQ